MTEARLDKHVTYHCGWHTFAALSLQKGISLSVVNDVLGHTTTKTREIYAEVVEKLRNFEYTSFGD